MEPAFPTGSHANKKVMTHRFPLSLSGICVPNKTYRFGGMFPAFPPVLSHQHCTARALIPDFVLFMTGDRDEGNDRTGGEPDRSQNSSG